MTDPTPHDDPPAAPPEASDKVDFPCPGCGAQLTWDPEVDALSCAYCAHSQPVPRAEGTIVEHALEDVGAAARGMGLDLRVACCGTCGAQVTFDGRSTAESCVFCGSSSVLEQEANRNVLRPESLIPLDVGRRRVEESFRRWVSRGWFRPSGLKKLRRFEAVGVYVPCWTFDCRVHSDWSADAGYYYYVDESYWTTVDGKRTRKTRRVRKVRWKPAWGQRDDVYDDVLVHASGGISESLFGKLGRFDLRELTAYRPEYLAGWRAEEYQVDLEQGWERATGIVKASQHARCARDVPGDTHRFLRVRNTVRDVRWKHVLLPVWSLSYRFKDRTYAVLVHGQSGRVVGEAPVAWMKVLLLVLGILALVAVGAVVFAVVAGGAALLAG